jgi:dienelactone hydrolase
MGELRDIEYEHEGVRLVGRLAMPAGPGPHPAVMVMHDARGQGAMVRQRALELAEAGYVALVTDMYGNGFYSDVPEEGGAFMVALEHAPQTLRDRVLRNLETLKAQPGVDAARIGAIGYCFGGQCVLELARSGADVRSVVSFHGLLTTQLPARPKAVKARIVVLTGALDPYAPLEHVQGFQDEMNAAEADYHVTIYGNGLHQFTDPTASGMVTVPGVKYDPLLSRLSWAQATAMLDATLKV